MTSLYKSFVYLGIFRVYVRGIRSGIDDILLLEGQARREVMSDLGWQAGQAHWQRHLLLYLPAARR